MKFLFLYFFMFSKSHAAIDVVFLQLKDYQGNIIQMEENGKYAHIAISFKGRWLHANPVRGVELITEQELSSLGSIERIIHLTDKADLDEITVNKYLGRPYDPDFLWSDEKIYCAELVAKLLDLPPQPMNFNSPVWGEKFKHRTSDLGLSPDDIYKSLKDKGYHDHPFNQKPCQTILRPNPIK